MDLEYPRFGTVVVAGVRYDHDIVIEDGRVAKRDKDPSRSTRSPSGHTPLTAAETIPTSRTRLIIGTGHSGRLPVMPDVAAAADAAGVQLDQMPTAEACALLRSLEPAEANAILHVTC